VVEDAVEDRMPSNERKIPPGAACTSFLTMRRRRPGAGLQGAVEGATIPRVLALCWI